MVAAQRPLEAALEPEPFAGAHIVPEAAESPAATRPAPPCPLPGPRCGSENPRDHSRAAAGSTTDAASTARGASAAGKNTCKNSGPSPLPSNLPAAPPVGRSSRTPAGPGAWGPGHRLPHPPSVRERAGNGWRPKNWLGI